MKRLLICLTMFLQSVMIFSQAEFIITYNTTNSGVTDSNSLRIPGSGGLYDVDVNNDGSYELVDQTGSIDIDVTVYGYTAGLIQVAIRNAISGGGNFESISFNNENDDTKLVSIDQWGSSIVWTSFRNAFFGCSNMDMLATDVPNLTVVSDFTSMFNNCNSMVGNASFNLWITSNITNMTRMFQRAASFNQPIGNWDVSSVTSFSETFRQASTFNQNINTWTLMSSSAVNMNSMFRSATAFNNGGASLNAWNTSSVTFMSTMFSGAINFNVDISGWNVSSCVSMNFMFFGASSFNRPLDSWGATKPSNTSIQFMFQNATSFNQDLNSWDVSNTTSFSSLFNGATAFNGDISSWDVSSATIFSSMFRNASAFNQDVSNWTVDNGERFGSMFIGATKFNHSLGKWNIGRGFVFNDMLSNSGLSQENWDLTLIGWHEQNFTSISNEPFGANGLTYCNARRQRESLESAGVFIFSGDSRGCTNNYMRNGKFFFNGMERSMEFGRNNK